MAVKKITYNGSSKVIKRLCEVVNGLIDAAPTVNDGKLTIQQNGTTVGTFTANQSSNTTVNLTGGGSGGHTIEDSAGTDMTQRSTLQFVGLTVADDAGDDKTVVTHAINSDAPTFTEAGSRTNVASGDSISTLFGKIKKYFSDLKAVAFTGSYSDLTGKPTIPTVNDATLTIQKNGTSVGTFTANASTNATANISVPVNLSELNNDSGYTTNTGTVTSVATGAGLTGGPITGSGTIKAALKSETKSSLTADAMGSTASRQYAVGLDSDGNLSVNIPWEDNDKKVEQTATSTNSTYEVLFSNSANNTTETAGARKDTGLTFNPSTDTLGTKYVTAKVAKALTGSGTAGSDAGSGTSPRYTPSLWTFNAGVTVANGEVYLIRIPVSGGTYGVWMSLNNGTNYYPVAISNSTGRFTTHYARGTVIAVTYESASTCNCYAREGADALADVTGCFRVLNDYDSGNNRVTQTATTTNANYEVLFSQTADNTNRTEQARKNSNFKFNPSTGNLQATQLNGVTIGSSPKFTDTTEAIGITFDNTGTDLSATDVQNAVAEVNAKVNLIKTGFDIKENVNSSSYWCGYGYGTYLFLVFEQGTGSFTFTITVNTGNISLKSLCEFSESFIQDLITASYATDVLTITFLTGAANVVALHVSP